MFCGKCGKKIEDTTKFCPYCGTAVDQKSGSGKKNTGKIVGAILVIAIIAVAALLWSQRKPKNTYEDYLAEAEQYLSELKYVQAEKILKQAIKIKPERKEAYVFLAEVYEADDKQEDAVEILKTSLKRAKLQAEDQKEIQGYIENIQNGVPMKADSDAKTKEAEETNPKQSESVLTDYLKNTLIPDEGKIEEVAETKDFEMSQDISESEQKKLLIGDGIVASFIEDMDGDGQKELHVFRNESINEDSNYYNRIFWEVYTCEDETVKKAASQEILQYQSLYAYETYNIYLKKNNGFRYIYSEADGVSIDAKMERVQSVFSYTEGEIKIEKSLVTTGGNGGFVDIYDSDSVYLPYAKRWVNGEEDKNEDAKEYYVYGDGSDYSDFDSYLEGYTSALGKELFDYGISMPIIEQTVEGQYPFFDIYLANAAKFDENLFNYRLQKKSYDFEISEGKKLKYTKIIKNVQVDTGKEDLSTYVEKELIPKYGQCNTGKYECEYIVNSNGGASVDSVHSEKGILNWHVADYDGDGTEELLVLLLDNQAKINHDSVDRNSIYLQMYVEEDGSIELKDTYEGLCPVLGYGDEENDGIFLKESDQKIYICGSTWNTLKNYVSGIIAQSFILTYENGKFVVQAGQIESVSGSEFSECADTVEKMADVLNKIGLEKEADQLYVPAFQFNDSVDQTLLRITGENKGFKTDYFTSNKAEDLGKVELTLTCSDTKDEKNKEEAENGSEKDSEYILPDSDSRYLTDTDVQELSYHDLMLARNEIYARHGRKFKDSELQDYFNSKSWYKGTVDPDDFSTNVFNKYEKKNLELIQKYEK